MTKLQKNAKKLKDYNRNDLGITGAIYINNNLCLYYKKLRYKCKTLWEANLIYGFWVSYGKVFWTPEENNDPIQVARTKDIIDVFPDEDLETIYITDYPHKPE